MHIRFYVKDGPGFGELLCATRRLTTIGGSRPICPSTNVDQPSTELVDERLLLGWMNLYLQTVALESRLPKPSCEPLREAPVAAVLLPPRQR